MIRQDYILRMIQEFMQILSRIKALKKDEQWQDATVAVDEELNRLVGAGAEAVAELSETELLAKLVQGESTLAVRHKTLLLTTLLKEAGDFAAAQDRAGQARLCYLKGLHLLLDALASNEIVECPDFVPKVELFVEALRDAPLPVRTQAMLMQHYERSGQFALAEDALFAILDAQPHNPEALGFGLAFFERLRGRSDTALEDGNLPRPELEAGLTELRRRQRQLEP